jgi:hypothetical protein
MAGGTAESTAQATEAPRMIPEAQLNQMRSAYDRKINELTAQMLTTQDAAFEANLQAQGADADAVNVARQRYYSSRELQVQKAQLEAEKSQFMAERNAGAREAMIAHYSKEWGVKPEVLARAKDTTEFFAIGATHLAQKTRNSGRATNVDSGGGSGGAGMDVDQMSSTQKLRIGLAALARPRR